MTQARHPTIRTFNPGTFQSDEEVIQQFVVREHELATVLEILRGNVDADSCQHTLIVAPRGRGKTMLLARVAAELRTNAELSTRMLPIRFMEESHEIFSAADFWLDVLFYLSRETRSQDAELARNLQDTHADLTTRWRERELDERARTAVLDVADRLGKRLVLMVENLQALCDNVDANFGWKLRKTLQMEPQIILLASATSRFEGLDDAQDPFFELFRIICLQPLDTEQCHRLWQAVSGDSVSARRIRALQILTGGDPRLLVIVAEFQRHGSMRRLMEQLVEMIDDHTEYFRGHLETLGKTERRVYIALMDLWEPSTTGEISARARLDVRTVSTMLGRLVLRGAVEPRDEHRRYAVTQRLYGVYFKLRRERDEAAIVRHLLHFMDVFYSDNEATRLFGNLPQEALKSPAILTALERAQSELPQLRAITAAIAHGAQTLVNTAIEQIQRAEYDAAITTCDAVLARYGTSDSTELQVEVIKALVNKGIAQDRGGNPRMLIHANREVIARFEASSIPALQQQIAIALFNTGAAQMRLGDLCGALATYDQFSQRFGPNSPSSLNSLIAKSLINRGSLQGNLGDRVAELKTYRTLIDRYGTTEEPDLQIEVATGLFNSAVVHGAAGNHLVAIATCDEVVSRYGTSALPELQSRVARSLVSKGVEQVELGHYPAAITTFESVVERYGESKESLLQEWLAQSLVNKAVLQDRQGDAEGAIATAGEVLTRYGQSKEPELQVQVAAALAQRGAALASIGRHDDAIDADDEVWVRFQNSDAPGLPELAAVAMKNKAVSLRITRRYSASIATVDELFRRFESCGSRDMRVQVAEALFQKGMCQIQLSRFEGAIRVSEELEHRARNGADDTRAGLEWKSRYVRMSALIAQGSRTEATDAFCSVYAALSPGNETMILETIEGVANLLAGGVPERELVAILRSEAEKAAVLAPLIIALRQRAGEVVRAPAQILDVAADVRLRIDERPP